MASTEQTIDPVNPGLPLRAPEVRAGRLRRVALAKEHRPRKISSASSTRLYFFVRSMGSLMSVFYGAVVTLAFVLKSLQLSDGFCDVSDEGVVHRYSSGLGSIIHRVTGGVFAAGGGLT